MRAGASNWARPDVPLMVPYKHRRVISIFDVNMWFYCGVQPEYFINSSFICHYEPKMRPISRMHWEA